MNSKQLTMSLITDEKDNKNLSCESSDEGKSFDVDVFGSIAPLDANEEVHLLAD